MLHIVEVRNFKGKYRRLSDRREKLQILKIETCFLFVVFYWSTIVYYLFKILMDFFFLTFSAYG